MNIPFRTATLGLAVLLAACADHPDSSGERQRVELPDAISTTGPVPAAPPESVAPEKEAAATASDMRAGRRDAPAPQAMAELKREAVLAKGKAATAQPMRLLEADAMPAAPSLAGNAIGYVADSMAPARYTQVENTERYQHKDDNAIKAVAAEPVSTFSLDVDTGSYSNVRRFLAQGQLPPQDAVRVEELMNYFPYDYPQAKGEDPFGIDTELAPCPWNAQHWLMRVSVRADEVDAKAMPPANLVFLVDVSGSMDDPAKLPLLKSSLKLLVDQLRAQDRVSLVVYAGREAVVLEPTAGDQHEKIDRAIDNLSAGGSTAGEAGIKLAYRMAKAGYIKGGINRVLIATDGDFNVGLTDFEALKDMVERERASGVQFSTLGFGAGNYNEQLMEQLADAGNGSYAYIDTLQEGRKVLVDQVRSTLVTVAKDVKVQVEFNPRAVGEYRLIGYENRMLAREDFNNDQVDAGDVGAGATVTALYEITPAGTAPAVDALRYDPVNDPTRDAAVSRANPRGFRELTDTEVAFVKLRYKQPEGSTSKLVSVPVTRSALKASFAKAGEDFRFATAVAGFGQLLRGGKYTGQWTFEDVLSTANAARSKDEFGYRSEFTGLVRMAKTIGGS